MTTVTFALTPTPPFRLDLTAWALKRRPANPLDVWDGRRFLRVLPGTPPLLIECWSEAGGLRVRARGDVPDAALRERAERGVRKLLGLDIDMSGFHAMAAADPVLAPFAARFLGFRPPRYPSVFEALLNAVACQQVSLEFGLTMVARLAERYGGRPWDDGPPRLPAPAELAEADDEVLAGMGLSRAKVRTLRGLARAFLTGELDEDALAAAPDAAIEPTLSAYFGVGRWTSDYVRLRGLARFAVFPAGDSGARRGVARALGLAKPDPARIDAVTAGWYPYGGLAYLTLLLAGLEAKGVLAAAPDAAGGTARAAAAPSLDPAKPG